jgi:hypothetical protein
MSGGLGWVTRVSSTSVAGPQATPANLFAGAIWIGSKLAAWGSFAHTLSMISKLLHVFLIIHILLFATWQIFISGCLEHLLALKSLKTSHGELGRARKD